MLIGALNPEYVEVVSICDIRPYNIHRAFHGDWASDAGIAARPGPDRQVRLCRREGGQESTSRSTSDYKELLEEPGRRGGDHRPAAVPARAGRDRGPEGRQARADRKADGPQRRPVQGDGPRRQQDRTWYLAVGHQRHYSVLYDNAVNLHPLGPARRDAPHSRPVAPRQPARRRQLAAAAAFGGEQAFDKGEWKKIELRRRGAQGASGRS